MNQRKIGAILSYVSMGITILSNFIYVPVLLYFVTQEEYGVYQIMGSMIAYLSVMDFGLTNTIIRYYSRYLVSGDKKSQENVLAISMLVYGAITVIATAVCIVLYQYISVFFGKSLSAYELDLARQIYIILVINVILSIPSHVFSAVIQSHEKYIFQKGILILQAILQPVVVIAVISQIPNVVLIAAIQMCLNIVVILLNVYYCFGKIKIKIKLWYWDKGLLKQMLRFAFFIFLGSVVDQINMKTDQMILGAVSGAAAAAVYSISSQLQMAFMNFSTAINNVFLPRISMISAKTDDMGEMNEIFLKVGRLQLFVILYIYGGFVVLGQSFITNYWVGEVYKEAYWYTLIVMTSVLIPLSQNTGIFILQAKNKHEFRAILYAFLALIHFAVAIVAAKYFGGMGCAITMAATQVIGNTVIIDIYYKKKIGVNISAYYKNLVPMILLLAVNIILAYFIMQILPDSIVGFFITGVLYTIIYWLCFVKLIFNDYEKNLIFSRFKFRWGQGA